MSGTPLVTIKCMVYNHEPFLRQCLEGIVMQKTNFPFEAIVHDDASTDGSAAIIREYAEKYPDIIKPMYETENQYSKKAGAIGKIMDAVVHPAAKYIAYCEGDDYWTDPNKLQLQVDFLESHPDYVLCTHDYLRYFQDSQQLSGRSFYGLLSNEQGDYNDIETFDLDNYFDKWWTQPLTCVFRRLDYRQDYMDKGYRSIRDDIFYYYVLTHGKGALMHAVMGVYRVHGGGVWSKLGPDSQTRATIENGFALYKTEGDRRALRLTRRKTLGLLARFVKEKEFGLLMRELKQYYSKVPFSEFMSLLFTGIKDVKKIRLLNE